MHLFFHGRVTLCAGSESIMGTWDAASIVSQNKEDELRCFKAFRRELLCSLERKQKNFKVDSYTKRTNVCWHGRGNNELLGNFNRPVVAVPRCDQSAQLSPRTFFHVRFCHVISA